MSIEHGSGGTENQGSSNEINYKKLYSETHPDLVDEDKARVMADAEALSRDISWRYVAKAGEKEGWALRAESDGANAQATGNALQPSLSAESLHSKAQKYLDKAELHTAKAVQDGEDAGGRYDEGKKGESLLRKLSKEVRGQLSPPNKVFDYQLEKGRELQAKRVEEEPKS